ncbi:hypothetical protein I603_2185 [Erythrobacter dokdonensis DSW-74]|uniref:Uncharacterized protein n=1 Tax=Erythrobacter dokdonensis DSW-74 TaxID=1300349 RepID=A0A1A7BCG9_9SPHN|nr:hypothetical protein I603_2185 [Erythrobacter dokdonensis DSW-74]
MGLFVVRAGAALCPSRRTKNFLGGGNSGTQKRLHGQHRRVPPCSLFHESHGTSGLPSICTPPRKACIARNLRIAAHIGRRAPESIRKHPGPAPRTIPYPASACHGSAGTNRGRQAS